MHSIAEIGSNVPAFLAKLWKMVEDPVTNDLISWSSNGTSFIIKDEIRFARELLPMYYKHNNMASFIRQLNMYGFHKIVSPEAGTMKVDAPDEIQFSHPFFIRGHSYLLDDIKRKIAHNKNVHTQLGDKPPNQVLGKVLTDVRQMKGRQESMDSRLTAMKLENGALWRELSVLRQKHIKQQQMVNKLIQFLVSLVHQNPKLFNMKRKYPRMLQQKSDHINMSKFHQSSATPSDPTTDSPMGPVIHELEDPAESLMDTVALDTEVETEPESPSQVVTHYFMDQSVDDTEDQIIEEPTSVQSATEPEILIGIPEDVLVFDASKQDTSNVPSNIVYSNIAEQITSQPQARAKYNIKLIPDNINTVANQRIKTSQKMVIKNQQTTKQALKQDIQMNQRLIERNKEHIYKSEELKRKQQRVLKNQQEILKNRQIILKNNQEIINNQQLILESPPQVSNADLSFQNKQNKPLKGNQLKIRNPQQRKKLNADRSRLPRESKLQSGTFQQVPKSPQVTTTVTTASQPLQKALEQEFLLDDLQQEIIADSDNSPQSILSVVGNTGCGEGSNMALPIVVDVPNVKEPAPSLSPLIITDPILTPQASTPGSSDMAVACLDEQQQVSSPSIVTRKEMDNHIDSVQSDLESLKELLCSEGITFDANHLLACFNEDPLSYNMSDPVSNEDPNRPKESGNELMTYGYNPSLLDLTDLIENEWSLPSPVEDDPSDDTFGEINTPQFVPQSPSFHMPSKRRKT